VIGALSGGIVVGNEVRLNHGVGLAAGSNEIVKRNWIHHNGQLGVSAPGATDTVFAYNEIDHNNTMGFHSGWEAGSSKFSGTTHLVFRKNNVHDNWGSGPWFDGNNYRYIVAHNRVEGNRTDGIVAEISYGGIIRDNVLHNNGHCTECWGAGVLIGNSSGVNVYGNTFSRNNAAILLVMYERTEAGRFGAYDLRNNRIHDNAIALGDGTIGIKQFVDDTSYFTSKGNTFDYDDYVAGSRSAPFTWQSGFLTFNQFQSAGQERHGTWRR
jgi:hypothetical protein